MTKEEKALYIYRKSMTKKEWKMHCNKDRGQTMPRPALFNDKRYRIKHKNKIF